MTVKPIHPLNALLRTALPPLLLSLLAGVACYVATGPNAGLFFGAVVMVALITPPLVTAHVDRARQALTVAAVVDGVAAACLFAVSDPAISLLDFIRAYVLLAAWGAALWGISDLLRRVGVAPVFASAITVALALAWLAWPMWLSPRLAGHDTVVAWLVAPHPLFGLDGALRHLGPPWTERHLMYTRLSVLNQDVFYSLPAGALRATLVHGAVALACLVPWRRLAARRGRPDGGDAALQA
jgi:hypothetical protein